MNVIALEGKRRQSTGKKASKLERREEMVPCVLYGGEETINFTAKYNGFRKIIYTDKFIRVDLDIDGNKRIEKCLVRIRSEPYRLWSGYMPRFCF